MAPPDLSAPSSAPAEPSSSMADAEAFHEVFQDLLRLHLSRDRERVAYFGVTLSGARALETLVRLGPLPLHRLATELFVDKSTASRTVALLEDRGLVWRALDPADRRALRLDLTPEGRTLAAQLHDDSVWEISAMLGGFAPETRRDALAFLRQLTRTSAAHAGVTEAACCQGS